MEVHHLSRASLSKDRSLCSELYTPRYIPGLITTSGWAENTCIIRRKPNAPISHNRFGSKSKFTNFHSSCNMIICSGCTWHMFYGNAILTAVYQVGWRPSLIAGTSSSRLLDPFLKRPRKVIPRWVLPMNR